MFVETEVGLTELPTFLYFTVFRGWSSITVTRYEGSVSGSCDCHSILSQEQCHRCDTCHNWEQNNCKQKWGLKQICRKYGKFLAECHGEWCKQCDSVTGVTVDEQVDNPPSSYPFPTKMRNTLERIREICCGKAKKYN